MPIPLNRIKLREGLTVHKHCPGCLSLILSFSLKETASKVRLSAAQLRRSLNTIMLKSLVFIPLPLFSGNPRSEVVINQKVMWKSNQKLVTTWDFRVLNSVVLTKCLLFCLHILKIHIYFWKKVYRIPTFSGWDHLLTEHKFLLCILIENICVK